jgi:uncharacterized protein (TIGR02996 family)
MGDENDFLRAILVDPGDQVPLLVYADWLEARGDPRGEYIHVRAAAATNPTSRRLRSRLKQLRVAIAPGWLPLLDGAGRQQKERNLLLVPKPWRRVQSLTELRQRLTGTLKQEEFFVTLNWDPGDGESFFMVFASGNLACVSVTDLNGDEAARSRCCRTPPPARATHPFPAWPEWHEAERVDIHLGWTIPREDALLALEYHYIYFGDEHESDHDTLAPWVAWEEYPSCRLGARPKPARLRKRSTAADDGD